MAGESRFTKAGLNELSRLKQGYKLPVENEGAPAMEQIDPAAFLSNWIKRVDIGAWNLFTTPVKTVSLAAYEGIIKGIAHVEIIDDDGYSYDGSALFDSWIFNNQNVVAEIKGNMDAANGSNVQMVAHGFIHSNGEKGSCAIYSGYKAGLDYSIVKTGQTFDFTFAEPTGVNAQNSQLIINVLDETNDELEEYYITDNGFKVDFGTAVSFYYTIIRTETGLPPATNSGSHTHGQSGQSIMSNTNLFNFNIIRRINLGNNAVELTHNYHGQVSTGVGTFGAAEKVFNASALPKFRSRPGGATRGYIWLLLDYEANPY